MRLSLHRAATTSVPLAVAQFAAAGLVMLLLLGGASALVLRSAGDHEAVNEAKRLTSLAGHGIVEPNLPPGGLAGNRAALARLDEVVHQRVLGDPIVRVKLWDPTGRIVYSDEPRLIGRRYTLGADDLASLRTGAVDASVSDLNRPENRYERQAGKLLEVYLPLRADSAHPLLFEAYLRYGAVAASAHVIWLDFLPILVLALAGLWLIQLPLAWRLAHSLRKGRDERERLLRHALDASDLERRRISSDLHDGAVQDLAGTAFALAATAERLTATAPDAADALRSAASETRSTIRQLRTLLVDVYPPSLHRAGLRSALTDLTAPLTRHRIASSLDVPEELPLPRSLETLLFRVARESLRNVERHSGANQVDISVARENGSVRLVVADNGHGFDDARRLDAAASGHLGLALIEELARDAGASLSVTSSASSGTRVEVVAPVS